MNHRNLSSAGRARRFCLGAGLLPVLAACAAAASGLPAERSLPGPVTHLVRLAVPNRGMAVFLPSSEIASKDGAAAYLAWARETFPAWSGRMKGVWDDEGDSVELRILAEPPELYAELLRKDDEVVDPSGRNVFVVAETPRKGDETVRVRMKSPFGTGEATPKTCITNVWALSRTNLLARWRNALEDGRRAEVRREIDTLERAGRFSASFHDGGAWEDDVAKFALDPRMRARIVFTNESGRTVLLAVEGSTNVLSAGAASSWGPSGPEGKRRVSWSARDDSDPATADADWTWKSGEAVWTADGDDVVVRIAGPVGTLKENPSFLLSFDQLAGAKEIAATVRYDKGGEEPALAVESAPGGRRIRVAPGRKILSVQISAEGFRTTEFFPLGGPASFKRGADPIPLEGGALRPVPKPWPAKLVVEVDRNGYEGPVFVKVFGFPNHAGNKGLAGTDVRAAFDLTKAFAGVEDSRAAIEVSVSAESVEPGSSPAVASVTIRRGESESRQTVKLKRPAFPSPPASVSSPAVASTSIPTQKIAATATTSPISSQPSGFDVKSDRVSSTAAASWPERERLSDATIWLSKGRLGTIKPVLEYAKEGARKQFPAEHKKAIRQLTELQAFWPVRESDENVRNHFETFRSLVEHLAECSGSCDHHGDVRNDPKKEALRLLGWKESEQRLFCSERLGEPGFEWPWSDVNELSDFMVFWWTQVRRDATDPKNLDWKTSREEAVALWTGRGPDGEKFKAAYRHAEICPGCGGCLAFRDSIRKGSTFKARRRAFFGALLSCPDVKWDDEKKPNASEIRNFADKLDEWERTLVPETDSSAK